MENQISTYQLPQRKIANDNVPALGLNVTVSPDGVAQKILCAFYLTTLFLCTRTSQKIGPCKNELIMMENTFLLVFSTLSYSIISS